MFMSSFLIYSYTVILCYLLIDYILNDNFMTSCPHELFTKLINISSQNVFDWLAFTYVCHMLFMLICILTGI